jgi:hypothetical protein
MECTARAASGSFLVVIWAANRSCARLESKPTPHIAASLRASLWMDKGPAPCLPTERIHSRSSPCGSASE